MVKHWLSFLAVTCFPRVGGVTTLSACVSSFWIWAGLHSNARGGAERNAHRFPLFLACFACRFWLLPHGIGKGNCYHPVPPPTFLHSPSLSLPKPGKSHPKVLLCSHHLAFLLLRLSWKRLKRVQTCILTYSAISGTLSGDKHKLETTAAYIPRYGHSIFKVQIQTF